MHFRHPCRTLYAVRSQHPAPSDVLPHIRTRIADGQEHAFHNLPDTKGTDILCQLRFCRSALMVPEVLMCHWTRLLSDQSLAFIAFEKLFSFCWLHYTTEISCVTHDLCIFVYFYQGCRRQHVDSIQNSENFNWDGSFKKCPPGDVIGEFVEFQGVRAFFLRKSYNEDTQGTVYDAPRRKPLEWLRIKTWKQGKIPEKY